MAVGVGATVRLEDLAQRLQRLMEEHLHRLDGAYCVADSCVELRWECAEKGYDYYDCRRWELRVEAYGPDPARPLRALADRLAEVAKAKAEYEAAIERFKRGEIGLAEARRALQSYRLLYRSLARALREGAEELRSLADALKPWLLEEGDGSGASSACDRLAEVLQELLPPCECNCG